MNPLGKSWGLGTASQAPLLEPPGAGIRLPEGGTVFLSVKESDKPFVAPLAEELVELGFRIIATRGTRRCLQSTGIDAEVVNKVTEDARTCPIC